MELAQIVELISTFGFTAAILGFLMWDGYRKDERAESMMCNFKDVIQSNTLALELLKLQIKNLHEVGGFRDDELEVM